MLGAPRGSGLVGSASSPWGVSGAAEGIRPLDYLTSDRSTIATPTTVGTTSQITPVTPR
jgi:hypothetical protein